jgi:hypothetical protein
MSAFLLRGSNRGLEEVSWLGAFVISFSSIHADTGMVPQIVNTTVLFHFLANSLYSDRPFKAWERPELLTVTLNEPQQERFWPVQKASILPVVMGHETQDEIKHRVKEWLARNMERSEPAFISSTILTPVWSSGLQPGVRARLGAREQKEG